MFRWRKSKGLRPEVKTHLMGLSKNAQVSVSGIEYMEEGKV